MPFWPSEVCEECGATLCDECGGALAGECESYYECDCDPQELFDADELGLDPEQDDQRKYRRVDDA